MREFIKIMINLTIVCLFVGITLGGIYSLTQPQIVRVQKEQSEKTRKELLPDAVRFEEREIKGTNAEGKETHFRISEGLNGEGKIIGYIIDTESPGYSSMIRIMYGVDDKFEVTRVKILSQGETPGLGTLITKEKFLDQFQAKDANRLDVFKGEDPYSTKADHVSGLTGATISSRAVADGIKNGLIALMREKGVSVPYKGKGE